MITKAARSMSQFSIFKGRISILDRYLFREFTGPFFLAVGGFALIAVVDILFYLVELAVISGVSFYTVLRLLLYKLPGVMVLFFPMAVLFAVMLLLVRMAKDNELTVLRASGVNLLRIVFPVALLALSTTFLSYATNEKLVPWTNRASEELIRYEVRKRPPPDIVENTVFKDADDRFFYVRKVDNKMGTMQDILIFEQTSRFPRIITADEARWADKKWVLMNGSVKELNREGDVDFVDAFSEMVIHVDADVRNYMHRKTAREMDSKELKDKISTRKKGGLSVRNLKVEYHMKKSVPGACFVFGIIGIAFCLNFVRSGKDWWGVIFAICVSVLSVGLYFFVMAVFRALAKDGSISAFWGAWIPNILYLVLGTFMIFYKRVLK
jgi:lipopolysaccharide export system permease protein